jgi:hypothetical protein
MAKETIIRQSPELICEEFVYNEAFVFQRMTKDSMWYVTYNNRIIAWGQYRNDLTQWIDAAYSHYPDFKITEK